MKSVQSRGNRVAALSVATGAVATVLFWSASGPVWALGAGTVAYAIVLVPVAEKAGIHPLTAVICTLDRFVQVVKFGFGAGRTVVLYVRKTVRGWRR